MATYRRKPVEIEARQLIFPEDAQQLAEWIREENPDYKVEAFKPSDDGPALKIEASDRKVYALWREWIIKGIDGDFYPMTEETFDKSYDPV